MHSLFSFIDLDGRESCYQNALNKMLFKKSDTLKRCLMLTFLRMQTLYCANMETEAFQKSHIVPDVIDKAPGEPLEISYPSGVKVDMGNTLTPTQVKNIPTVKWAAESGKFHTLCLVDPDAPSRKEPKFREVKHWLVGNIPGEDVAKGDTLAEYIGPGPLKGTDKHRYVFLLYQQNEKITFHEKRLTNKSQEHRRKFSIKKFTAKHKLGEPIAGNFYEAEWDDYVPILYQQLDS